MWATSIGISPVNAQTLWSLARALSSGPSARLIRDLLGFGKSLPSDDLFWLREPESSTLFDVDGVFWGMRCIHKHGISWHLSAKKVINIGSTLATLIIVCSRSRLQTCRKAQKADGTRSFPRASPSSVISCIRLALGILRCSRSGSGPITVPERPRVEEDIPSVQETEYGDVAFPSKKKEDKEATKTST